MFRGGFSFTHKKQGLDKKCLLKKNVRCRLVLGGSRVLPSFPTKCERVPGRSSRPLLAGAQPGMRSGMTPRKTIQRVVSFIRGPSLGSYHFSGPRTKGHHAVLGVSNKQSIIQSFHPHFVYTTPHIPGGNGDGCPQETLPV